MLSNSQIVIAHLFVQLVIHNNCGIRKYIKFRDNFYCELTARMTSVVLLAE